MNTIEKLPEGNIVIGTKEVIRAAKAGKVKIVVVASNCPQFLIDKVEKETEGKVEMKQFSGDQKDLATRLGKPFAIALVGYA